MPCSLFASAQGPGNEKAGSCVRKRRDWRQLHAPRNFSSAVPFVPFSLASQSPALFVAVEVGPDDGNLVVRKRAGEALGHALEGHFQSVRLGRSPAQRVKILSIGDQGDDVLRPSVGVLENRQRLAAAALVGPELHEPLRHQANGGNIRLQVLVREAGRDHFPLVAPLVALRRKEARGDEVHHLSDDRKATDLARPLGQHRLQLCSLSRQTNIDRHR
eukprot:scaffold1467_cov264-Pinguiococcus_pyrenoidosus.AAC.16